MADAKLTDLGAASAPDLSEYLYAVQGGAGKKLQLSQVLKKNNFAAAAAPTAGADASAGYSAGSFWFWSGAGATAQLWICRDASAGAAVWTQVDTADHPGYIPGNWYLPYAASGGTGSALAANTISILPMILKSRVSISQLGARITTGSAGGNVQLALYAHLASSGRPTGAALGSTGSISTTSTGVISAALAGGNITLEPGLYWTGINADNATVALVTHTSSQAQTAMMVGSATLGDILWGSTGLQVGLTLAQSYGSWPDVTGQTWTETSTSGAGSAKNALLAFKAA
jgi:hypothetical protein